MHIGVDFGREHVAVAVDEKKLVKVRQAPAAPPESDPAAAMRRALDEPVRFPALRRALTPDDHVVIVVDEQLPHLPALLTPLLEHVAGAHIPPELITLLCPTPAAQQPWLDELPDAFQEMHVEIHNPSDRRHLSYLATTRAGRRVYLNRTAIDADQLIVVAKRGYDPLLGYSGGEGALYPALSDEATLAELGGQLSMEAPGETPWPVRQEATEVAWLLGAPFMVQVIEGHGDEIVHVVAGLSDSSADGQRLLDARWRTTVAHPADTVVASLSGDPARHDFADLARALACASRVVKSGGRIVLLSRAQPTLGPGAETLRQAEDPQKALDLLRQHFSPDRSAAYLWANSMQQASVYLLSGLRPDLAEELFVTPLEEPGQVQRLVDSGASCLFLSDAHKMLAVVQ